jgi:MFS transporter, DHA1 family, tetracycline resistance protein
MRNETRRILIPYAIVILFAYIGFSLPLPILPEMFLDPTRSILPGVELHTKMILLGLVMASFPLGQFFGSPILGRLSDCFGRKKIVLLSLCGTVLGFLITAYAVYLYSVWGMFLGLAICGFCEGNVTIAQAVIADLYHAPSDCVNLSASNSHNLRGRGINDKKEQQREKAIHFGWINIFISIGFIVGPLIGGQLADPDVVSWFTFSTPFWAAACLTVIGILVIYCYSKETLKHKRGGKWEFFNSISNAVKRLKLYRTRSGCVNLSASKSRDSTISEGDCISSTHSPSEIVESRELSHNLTKCGIKRFYVANFFLALGYFAFFRFFPVFLERQFNFNPSMLSYVMVYDSLAIAAGFIWLVPFLSKHLKPIQSLSLFAFLLAATFIICLLPASTYALMITIPPLGVCLAVVITNGSLLISNEAAQQFQGQAMGTLTSVQVLAEIFTGLAGGPLAAYTMSLPLYLGAGMSIVGGLILLHAMRREKYV